MAMLGVAAATAFLSTSTQAQLDPYYVIRGVSPGKMRPRVLFVLDTSGSMSWLQQSSPAPCRMADCEGTSATTSSRIAAARQAIRKVIDQTQDVADFSLMTFKQLPPPVSAAELPAQCQSYISGSYRYHRFTWLDYYADPYTFSAYYATINGLTGRWRLCGENRPFPYLRWNNLGTGSVITSDDQTGAIPASPLISMSSTSFKGDANKQRKVQFFPKFMGIRVNLNDTTDPGKVILEQTWGDYGTTSTNRTSNVWKQDFYYWPYVDGFPGYGYHEGYLNSGSFVGTLGMSAWDSTNFGATLYAPFYLAGAAAKAGASKAGPLTDAEATTTVLGLSSPMHEGGVDVDGGTPWASTIGSTSVTPPNDNRPGTHSTVASYLKFVRSVSASDLCVPQTAVLVTDGDSDPAATEGGSILHQRLADLRRVLETKVYVVGFVHSGTNLNNMACAAAGSTNSTSPCLGTPARKWDTCADPSKPTTKCAFTADNATQLADTLTSIIAKDLALNLPSGPSYQVNEFGIGAGGHQGSGEIMQTSIDANTEMPAWKGHVVRSTCDWESQENPGELDAACVDKPFDESEPTFGPCAQGRTWDAGACLAATDWKARRVYVDAPDHSISLISTSTGAASSAFLAQLNSSDLALPGRPFSQSQADAIAAFVLGKDWPEGWKLPGLAQSAPMVVRRIPPKQTRSAPRVSIRDAHCAGRIMTGSPAVHPSLEAFADAAWDESKKISSPSHYEYQEGVLIGDDLGILHSFGLDHGNELWGFLPRTFLKQVIEEFGYGAATRGQPGDLDKHVYGLGGTANLAWAWDPNTDGGVGRWRHLAVISASRGGAHLMVLDVSHMSPDSPRGPFEILWTSSDASLTSDYKSKLGSTWSRPAISFHVPQDEINTLPVPYLAVGSGEPITGASSSDKRGRYLLWINALTGKLLDSAELPKVSGSAYGTGEAAVSDIAVGSHCISRYWAEAQEAYVADRGGRLYRWDLGRETSHAADSDGKWSGTAKPAVTFPACVGTDDYSCSVSSTNKGEPFVLGAAVAASNRSDDAGSPSGTFDDQARDRFLVALIGGSLLDDATSANSTGADYHPSLILLADDHRANKSEGFNIPSGAPIREPGEHSSYLRLPLSSIERTRVYQPIPGGPTYTETRKFSRRARPVRAPKISVTGLAQGSGDTLQAIPGYEVYYIEYTIYEPSLGTCDAAWHDASSDQWIADEGSTYVIRMRLIVPDEGPFDFINGSGKNLGARVGDTWGFNSDGLQMAAPEQVRAGECADGICGPQPTAQKQRPCDPNENQAASTGTASVSMGYRELSHFSPVELPENVFGE
jgi:hypothetical protein